MKRSAGMSLVELLAAVTIVTILASSAYLGYQNLIPEAQAERVHHDLETLTHALATYDRDHPTAPYSKFTLDELKGRYLDELPVDPWGMDFVVDPVLKRVISPGPDRKLQTAVPGFPDSPARTTRPSDDVDRPYGEQGLIAFIAGSAVTRIAPDGSNLESVITGLAAGSTVSQAPDRNRFLISASNKITLYTRQPDFSFEQHDLTFGPGITGGHDATFSPDGLKYAFIAAVSSGDGVGVGDITTGVAATLVTSSVASPSHPSPMKGNREIVFGDAALNVYRSSAAEQSALTTINVSVDPTGKETPDKDGTHPSVSPDGKLVAYVTNPSGGDIWVRATSEVKKNLVAKGGYKEAVFGPSGNLLAVTDGNTIWITSARASTTTSGLPMYVIDGLGAISSLSWQ